MHALRWAMQLLPSWTIVDRLVRRDPERWVHNKVHYYDETLEVARRTSRVRDAAEATRRVAAASIATCATRSTCARWAKFVAQLRSTTFPIPLQLIYAEHDPVVPPIVGDKLRALIPAAEFVQLANASHFAHVDAASTVRRRGATVSASDYFVPGYFVIASPALPGEAVPRNRGAESIDSFVPRSVHATVSARV